MTSRAFGGGLCLGYGMFEPCGALVSACTAIVATVVLGASCQRIRDLQQICQRGRSRWTSHSARSTSATKQTQFTLNI